MSPDVEMRKAVALLLVVFAVGVVVGAFGTAALHPDLEDLLQGALVVIVVGGVATLFSLLKGFGRRDPSKGVGPWGA